MQSKAAVPCAAGCVRLTLGARLLPAALALVLVYLNLAALFTSCGIRIELARPWYLHRPFQIFTLFSYYTSTNYGFEAVARVAGSGDSADGERWIPIDLYAYFPQVTGEANRRIYQDSFLHDPARQRKGQAYVLERIKALHNRNHPDLPIDRIRMYLLSWPKHTTGYKGHYDQRERRLMLEQ